MYYSDKGDGSNRKAVNLNNKEIYSIHVNIAGSGFTLEEIAEIINVTIVDYGM